MLPQTNITSLKCAARDRAIRPTIPTYSACDVTGSPLPSLNVLWGIDKWGRGTFTLDGFTPLCEAFAKMPNLTSVRCAVCDRYGPISHLSLLRHI